MRAITCKLVGLYVAVSLVGMGVSARPAAAQIDIGGLAKKAAKAAGSTARDEVVKKVNQKLLADGRKNQCSFQTDSDVLAPGCDQKLKNLAAAMVAAKKQLDSGSVPNYKFEVSGHTDTRGKADHNKELSQKRAAVIVRELVARGIPENQIVAVGMGSERPLVKVDNTPAKQAKNRRYEIQVR
jgi:outer membrane protein OmpA-like peptidoglycan-associated protein